MVARFRPQSLREGNGRCLKSLSEETVCFGSQESSNSFTFDRIYGEVSTQEDMFQDVKPIVRAVLNGYNGTVLAYGQTGSGKTHTLLGNIEDASQRGIVPRAIRELAEGIASCSSDCTFQVSNHAVEWCTSHRLCISCLRRVGSEQIPKSTIKAVKSCLDQKVTLLRQQSAESSL